MLSLPHPRRYEYFIKKVADWGQVWGLGSDDGWAAAADDEGRERIPIWPHERFAAACASGHWSGNEPRAIPLGGWLQKWLPGMQRDQLVVAVFPTPDGKGIPVAPERIQEDLEEELSGLLEVEPGADE